jgi:hypothetical protein
MPVNGDDILFKRLMEKYGKLADGRIILIFLFLFLLTNLFIVPAIYPKFQTLDTLSSYTPQKAYELISSYDSTGRQAYAIIEVTLDLAYPLIIALMFSLMILYTFKRAFPSIGWVQYVSLAPFAVMLSDYLENASVVTMLLSYPRELVSLAQIANVFTVAKFVLTPLQLLFIIGLIGWPIQVIRSKRQAGQRGRS